MRIMRSLLIVVLFLTARFLHGQDHPTEATNTTSSSENYKHLWKLAYDAFDIDNHLALFYARRAQFTAYELADSIEIVKSSRLLGQLLWRVDRLNESAEILKSVIGVATRHHLYQELNRIENSLALGYTYAARYDEALDIHFRLLEASDTMKNKGPSSITLNNIGLVYMYLGFYDIAIKYFEKSLTIKRQANFDIDIELLMANIANCYINVSEYDSAARYFKLAKQFAKGEKIEQTNLVCNFGQGLALFNRLQMDSARQLVSNALSIAYNLKNQNKIMNCLLLLTRIDLSRGDLTNARSSLEKIDRLPDINQYPNEMVDYYEAKAAYLLQSGRIHEAAEMQHNYMGLNKVVGSARVGRNVMQSQARFVERENLAKLAYQERILQLQERMISNRDLVNMFLATTIVLVVVVMVLLWRSAQQRKAINSILDRKVIERTYELQQSRESIRKVAAEDRMLLETIYETVVAHISTQRGLIQLLSKETNGMASNLMKYSDQNCLSLLEKLGQLKKAINSNRSIE